jgi:hypothetical protein
MSIDLLDSAAAHARREGEERLSLPQLYLTLSDQIGRRIRHPDVSRARLWIDQYIGAYSERRCDVILLNASSADPYRKLILNLLAEIKYRLSRNRIEFIIEDEEKLLNFLLSELKQDRQRVISINQLVERKILYPIARAFLERGDRERVSPCGEEVSHIREWDSRIVISDDFIKRGMVTLLKKDPACL